MTIDGALFSEILEPRDEAALAAIVAEARAAGRAIYPLGGRTSLNYGASATRPGMGLSLAALSRVIDYPARDMTITVEAGLTLAELSRTLSAEKQWLPVFGSQPDEATIGGLVATAWSDGRRYGWGTIRDYVIGVRAVDGRGTPFKAGGRVVKNVAGYDFCKLLAGSLGTLAVITEVTLRLKPTPERSAWVVAPIDDLDSAEHALTWLTSSGARPAAIELLVGPAWSDLTALEPLGAPRLGYLAVGFDGADVEVAWMTETLVGEWRQLWSAGLSVGDRSAPASHAPFATVEGENAAQLWRQLRDFAAAPTTFKAATLPSDVCRTIARFREADPNFSLLAHAGNGITLARVERLAGANRVAELAGRLRSTIAGSVTVVASRPDEPLGADEAWGPIGPALRWMQRVRRQFDPDDVLNPGRLMAISPREAEPSDRFAADR